MSRRNSLNTSLRIKLPLADGDSAAQTQKQSGSKSPDKEAAALPTTPPTSVSSGDRMQISPPGTPGTGSSPKSAHSQSSNGSSGSGFLRGSHSTRVRLGSARSMSIEVPVMVAGLPKLASASASASTSTSSGGSTSARPGGVPATRPDCPSCGRSDVTHRFGFWLRRGGWVWVCSAEPRGRDGQGTSFCGCVFYEDKPRAECPWCGVRLAVERRAGTFGYYCGNCAKWTE